MSEKLLRIERLTTVLEMRQIEKPHRARYLTDLCGSQVSYWSGLLAGARPFGEKTARKIEDALGLVRGTLDEAGTAPDTAAIAHAFDALPMDTPVALEMRKRVYVAIMGLIAASALPGSSSQEPPPAAEPNGEPPQHS